MGVQGIHIEQIFGPFGEKPGGPFFVSAMLMDRIGIYTCWRDG